MAATRKREIVIFKNQQQQDQPSTSAEIQPETIIASGQQEGIKEATKEATKVQTASDETYQEQGKFEGIKEVAKDKIKSTKEQNSKFETLVNKTKKPLLQLKTSGYLMLNFTPDILTIDPIKVSVIYRSILKDEQVRSVFIKDIGDVSVESIPFAASLRITDSTDKDNPILIKPFKKAEAQKAKRIIMGLITISKEDIDPTILENTDETIKKLETLGKGV